MKDEDFNKIRNWSDNLSKELDDIILAKIDEFFKEHYGTSDPEMVESDVFVGLIHGCAVALGMSSLKNVLAAAVVTKNKSIGSEFIEALGKDWDEQMKDFDSLVSMADKHLVVEPGNGGAGVVVSNENSRTKH